MDEDQLRWDSRYADAQPAQPTAPDVIAEHPELLEVLPESGKALDVACGLGAQSLWLAERGLDVVSLDISPAALDRLRTAATTAGLDGSITSTIHDTDNGLPSELRELSIIVCQRFRATTMYHELLERLRVGGVLIVTVLSAVGLEGLPGEFHAPAGELLAAYGDRGNEARGDREADAIMTGSAAGVVLYHQERDGQASIVVRRSS